MSSGQTKWGLASVQGGLYSPVTEQHLCHSSLIGTLLDLRLVLKSFTRKPAVPSWQGAKAAERSALLWYEKSERLKCRKYCAGPWLCMVWRKKSFANAAAAIKDCRDVAGEMERCLDVPRESVALTPAVTQEAGRQYTSKRLGTG